jgi:hypothetical protein
VDGAQPRAVAAEPASDGSPAARTSGQWKQDILRVYNSVNRDISGVGVSRQSVDLMGDRFLVVANHQRIPALASIDAADRYLTRLTDVALIDESKRRLLVELSAVLGLSVRTILKDYDPVTETAATVVILEDRLPVCDRAPLDARTTRPDEHRSGPTG